MSDRLFEKCIGTGNGYGGMRGQEREAIKLIFGPI